jgi:hypothetical protein
MEQLQSSQLSRESGLWEPLRSSRREITIDYWFEAKQTEARKVVRMKPQRSWADIPSSPPSPPGINADWAAQLLEGL